MRKPVVLLVGPQEFLRESLIGLLFRQGCEVLESSRSCSLVQLFQKRTPDLAIVTSASRDGREGLRVVNQIRQIHREIKLILITMNSSEELAIDALKVGVNDYFKHPVSFEDLETSINRCLWSPYRGQSPRREVRTCSDITAPAMIGESRSIQEIRAYIGNVAASDTNVLITGETGTGKELVAELIHAHSPRHRNPFISINCAAIPDSLLESELFGYERGAFTGAHALREGKLKHAGGGTAFLDEIGDMGLPAQTKILRAIESKEIQRLGDHKPVPLDMRVIAATNQDLEALVEERRFRRDLYFRINVARIHLPPLRDRREDIPLLLKHYVREMNHRFGYEVEGFTDEALSHLIHYEWPGNVRELKNVVESTFVSLSSQFITFLDLPKLFRQRLTQAEEISPGERERLLAALSSTNWNKSRAAPPLPTRAFTSPTRLHRLGCPTTCVTSSF
jgi:DNA-binding NtrC family response regulator